MRRSIIAVLFISAFHFLSFSALGQGSLTPPGPPTPTMKTLDQVEARTPVDSTHTPGDATYEFIIDQSGSYYLTRNIFVSKPTAIHITASGVTLDLNGFQIGRRTAGSGDGIVVSAANCLIKNGSITGFTGDGVLGSGGSANGVVSHVIASTCSRGIEVTTDGWLIDRCNANNNTSDGIKTAVGCTISYCTALNNAGSGIFTASGCTIAASTASRNSVGFNVGSGNTLVGSTAAFNTTKGIYPGSDSTIKDCSATSNGIGIDMSGANGSVIAHCAVSENTGKGISGGVALIITDCTVYFNGGDGITVNQSCQVISNNASSNVNGGAGIRTVGFGNRIDNNHCVGNASYGIKSAGPTTDIVIRNDCSGNAGVVVAGSNANYSPNSGTYFGPLGLPSTATSPWANF